MKDISRIFYWIPRIFCILLILFISLFAADAFTSGLTLGKQILGLLIHLIPSFILIAILVIAWRWEKVGGILFLLIGIGCSPFIFIHNYKMNNSISMSLATILLITFPFILVGLLFLLSHQPKDKRK